MYNAQENKSMGMANAGFVMPIFYCSLDKEDQGKAGGKAGKNKAEKEKLYG
jgi:hypothetical protein